MGIATHKCRLCSSEHRQQIEDWRFKEGLTYEAIIERAAAELGYTVSLNMLGRHLSYVGSEMAQIVEDQMREAVRDKGQLAANAPVNNIELCNALISRLVRVDADGHPVLLPMADDLVIDLLKERRQSAALILSRPGADAAKDALGTFADLMRRAVEAEQSDDEPEGTC